MTTRPLRPLRPHTDTRDRLTDRQYRALASQRSRLQAAGTMDDTIYRHTLGQYPCQTRPPQEGADWPAPGQPCTSRSHLSRAQARSLITRWTIAGAPVGGPYAGSRTAAREATDTGGGALPTPAQRAYIARLIGDIAWRTPEGYHGWLAARLRQDPATAPRTYQDAEAIIEGLRALQRHGHARAS